MPTEPGQAAGLASSYTVVHYAHCQLVLPGTNFKFYLFLIFILFLCCALAYTWTVYFIGQELNSCSQNCNSFKVAPAMKYLILPTHCFLMQKACTQMFRCSPSEENRIVEQCQSVFVMEN